MLTEVGRGGEGFEDLLPCSRFAHEGGDGV